MCRLNMGHVFAAYPHLYGNSDRDNGDTICLFNIAMENGPFIDGLPGFTY